MKKSENIIWALLILFILVSSIFFASLNTSSYAADSNLTNQTNNTNQTNQTKKINNINAAPQSVGLWPSVSLTITPGALDLGNVVNDGSTNSYLQKTLVSVSASQYFTAGTLTLSTKANGDFVNGANTITLNNFKYDGFSNPTLNHATFTTSYTAIKSWDMTGFIVYSAEDEVYGNYYLTIPQGTSPGTYSNTVYYMAMIS